MKKNLYISIILIMISLFTIGCSGANIDKLPDTNEVEEIKTVYASVSGQVFENDNYLMCGIIVKDTVTSKTEYLLTNEVGRFNLRLAKSTYELSFYRNVEFEIKKIEIEIKNQLPIKYENVQLLRLYNLEDYGYKSADLHQHTIYSDGRDTPYELNLYNQAIGLDFGFLTDHNSVSGGKEFLYNSSNSFTPGLGIEVTSADKGHFNILNTDKTYNYNFNSSSEMVDVINSAKSDTTFIQVNHPSRLDILGLAYWDIIGNFEGMEIWNGKDAIPMLNTNLAAKQKWYNLLNDGIFLTATAGSDNHGLSSQSYKIPLTYAKVTNNSINDLISSLKNGCVFTSNGAIIVANINGSSYGESVNAGMHKLDYNIMANENITQIRIFKNGILFNQPTTGQLKVMGDLQIQLSVGDYITIEVETENNGYALTNPIFCK